jgi:quercetin dioxygenase-like cupin family protein
METCSSTLTKPMDTSSIFPKGKKALAYFTGDAYIQMLSEDITAFDAMVYNVSFEPGSRNYWHTHSLGQILLCTSGEGYYQAKEKPVQKLKAGDVVEIPANIEHWHGAVPHSQFVHVGITPQANNNKVTWLEPVTDQEYNSFGS